MRLIFSLIHLLVGVFAIALVAGMAAWLLPEFERTIHFLGGAAMILLIARHIVRLIRQKKTKEGPSK